MLLLRAETWLHRQRRRLVVALATGVGAATVMLGLGTGSDDATRALRDALRSRPASGQVVVVAIDSESTERIPQWPWPRRHHAAVIDALSAAGAKTIAFDIDLSSPSTPSEDALLAAALERAGGGVILPTLQQPARAGSSRMIDRVPAPAFRPHSVLAAVLVKPDADGAIREIPLGAITDGSPRPSLAAMIAGIQGAVGVDAPIDYAIEPATIPTYSFVDIVERRVPASALEDKHVLIGATAIELGDRYAVPRFGVIPGVMIQALATETLLAGPTPARAGPVPALLVALLAVLALSRPWSRARRFGAFAMGLVVIVAGPLALESWFAISVPSAAALAALATAALAATALLILHEFARRVLRDGGTELPNLAAFEFEWTARPAAGVAAAHIANYAELASALGAARSAMLVTKLAERLALASERGAVFRTDDSTLAWALADTRDMIVEERLASAAAVTRLPVQVGDRSVDVILHFGVADAGEDVAQCVADAGLAAIEATEHGQRWRRFTARRADEADWRLSLLGELDRAIERGDLWVAYQPKLDLRLGRVTGAEALVRWTHPERGAIRPDDFIPMAEASGRITALTEFVLDRALADFAALDPALTVSVNVAANLLTDSALVATVEDALILHQVAASRLVIEVTESAAMADAEVAIKTLEALADLGVKISIDDYGTGQSTLSYLKRLPASELKIDQSFVRSLATSRSDAILVRSTIDMAHELGLKVVAEGVEDADCLERLRALGCDLIQGYHIGRPTPLDAFVATLVPELREAA